MPVSIQPRQGAEDIFLPLTQPVATSNSQGIGSEHNSLNSMREGMSTESSSCCCGFLNRIKIFFEWLFHKIFSRTTLVDAGQSIRLNHHDFLSTHISYPSKIVITIQLGGSRHLLDGQFVSVIKHNLENEEDFNRFTQEYETTVHNALQLQNLPDNTPLSPLTIRAFLYNKINLTQEQIQASGHPETFLYNVFSSTNHYDEDTLTEPVRSNRNGLYVPSLTTYMNVLIEDPQRRNEIREFLI